jgi:recombination protein RecR
MEYPSQSIQTAVEQLSKLPGIGKKTALRLALHLLKAPESDAVQLGTAIVDLRRNTRRCTECGNLTDGERCNICTSTRRNRSMICVVEEARDLLALEKTGQYNGLYHVLGGVINPMEGVGPGNLNIDTLLQRLEKGECKEVIMALSSTMEGETTAFYLYKKLAGLPVTLTNIARGIPMGSELEFTDELTLGRSLQQRTTYHNPLNGANGAAAH